MKKNSRRLRATRIAAAALMTITLALPTGLMGWAAASLLDSAFDMHSARPMWFLPLWCLWFFVMAYLHLADQEEDTLAEEAQEGRWGQEKKEAGWRRRDGAERFL